MFSHDTSRVKTTTYPLHQSPYSTQGPHERTQNLSALTAGRCTFENSRIALTNAPRASWRSRRTFRTPSFTVRPSESIVFLARGDKLTPAVSFNTHRFPESFPRLSSERPEMLQAHPEVLAALWGYRHRRSVLMNTYGKHQSNSSLDFT